MSRYFYAVEYLSGVDTTWGNPHPITGGYSRAVILIAKKKKAERDAWVYNGSLKPDTFGWCRKAVTLKECRRLHRGYTLESYNELLDNVRFSADNGIS